MKKVFFFLLFLALALIIAWYIPMFMFTDYDGSHYPNGGVSVYITDTGEKYHSSSCSYLRQSRFKLDLERAVEQGYTSCLRCDPPQFISVDSYQAARANQDLGVLAITIPIYSFLAGLLSYLIIMRLYFGIDNIAQWSSANCAGFFEIILSTLSWSVAFIQAMRVFVIW